MRGRVTLFCSFLVFLCLSSLPLHAAVQGHVIDSSQNPIEGAHVTFTDESNPANSFSGYTNADGWYEIDLTPLAVSEDQPQQFSLGQNFPNPFNPATTIPFSLETSSHVTLTIYNIMGQKVATVIDYYMSAGNHSAKWNGMDSDGNHVSSGIYLYRLKAGRHTETRKMLLLDGGGGAAGSKNNSSLIAASGVLKTTSEITYSVTITHDSIIQYKQNGVIVADGQTLDFSVQMIDDILPDGLTLVSIPGGTFEMGDEQNNLFISCRPVHTVTLSGYEMSIHEITNDQYAEFLEAALESGDIVLTDGTVTGATGRWKGMVYCHDNKFHSAGNRPVSYITWYGAKAFAEYYGLDLPTEAEWEYACRGGEQNLFGTDTGMLNKTNANYNFSGYDRTTDVGTFPPNPFGLYDMSGNLFEWCHDWLGDYTKESVTDPTGTMVGTYRVTRGGYYDGNAENCRSAYRLSKKPDYASHSTGFRVVRRKEGDGTSYDHAIHGKVLHDGSGMEDVTIAIPGLTTVTGPDGTYTLSGISDGTYAITFLKDGYTFDPSNMMLTIHGYDVTLDDVEATESGPVTGELPAGISFISLPGGDFEMGESESVHTVTLSPFEMSIHEITNAQYVEYLNTMLASGEIIVTDKYIQSAAGPWIGQNYFILDYPECEIEETGKSFSIISGKDNCPVFGVSWYGAKAFAEYYGLGIPTEAEWEYACRGGKQHFYGSDNGEISRSNVNYNWHEGRTTDVGSYPANPFGLYDMSGNVKEWCHDCWGLYPDEHVVDPTGPSASDYRIVRGGAYSTDPEGCRSARRYDMYPYAMDYFTGFRVVRKQGAPPSETYTVSGRVLFNDSGLAGVTVSFLGETVTTDFDGAYSFAGIYQGTRPIIFEKEGYNFSPSSINITLTDSDLTVDDIIPSKNGSISGRVLLNGSGLQNVGVTLDGQTITTGPDGMYQFTELTDGTYDVTFANTGYTFNPASITVTINGNDVTLDDVIAAESGGAELPEDITFVYLQGGIFEMGDELGDLHRGTRPVHTVTLSEFEISTNEITNSQYVEYLNTLLESGGITATDEFAQAVGGEWSGQNYLRISGAECEIRFQDNSFVVDSGKENRPVYGITWYGAKSYANYFGLDLPTEAEWEYACRGGQQLMYGSDDGTLSTSKMNYGWNVGHSTDVGTYPANPFGLYNMSGNICEWCHDWTAVYPSESVVNPSGPATGSNRSLRGGAWSAEEYFCRAAARNGFPPESAMMQAGFRVVRRPDGLIY